MKKNVYRRIIIIFSVLLTFVICCVIFTVFFDQAVLVRHNTFYLANTRDKIIALTFDDGPSAEWTPKILDELKNAGVKATFFMIGEHVQKYPDIARRVVREGHEVANHSNDHHVLIYYKIDELEKEIRDAEKIIRDITGRTTIYFRPPKAWLTGKEKKKIEKMGYKTILWTLNSKDWVNFDDKYIVRYILKHIKPGDILLFHDSGGVFNTEGGNREETVKTIKKLVEELKRLGYRFVTISELLGISKNNGKN